MTANFLEQLELLPLSEPECAEHLTLEQRFEQFHAANPHVADALETLAAQWLARHSRVSIKALMERARWESGIRTDGKPWRLNNSWTAFYARLLIARHPEWADAIETRRAQADRVAS